MRLFGRTGTPKVYVDAKILNMHDPALHREAYMGYVVDGSGKSEASKIEVNETEVLESDDAEVLAILFAIDRLKGSLRKFVVVCDHESVVSEANREEAKNPSAFMKRLRETLQENRRSVSLEALMANPAHGVVTEYVNRMSSRP